MSIVVEDLTKNYGSLQVLFDISFRVEESEFVSLLGPSGCGKTTTLRCIAGLEQADGGTISIDGGVVSSARSGLMVPAHGRHVGMVFQSYAIWPHMSVADNVGFPLRMRNFERGKIRSEVEQALDIVGLAGLKDRLPAQLSGGQQQRVALARAIVGSPRVLLFDEPLSNLDAKLRESTRREIKRIQRQLGVAAIYVTHDQEEALSMSDRIIVMDRGHIVQSDTPKALYQRPVNGFVANFIGRATFIDVSRDADGKGWHAPDGTPLMVDESAAAADGEGQYQAMLRPEAIELTRTGHEGAPDSKENRLTGRIEESYFFGSHTEYLIATTGTTINVNAREDLPVGTEVVLKFKPQDCYLVKASVKS